MDIWHSDTHTGSSSDPFEYPQIMCVVKLDGCTYAGQENPLNYSRPWARSAALTLRMSDKSPDLVSVNTGTRQTSYNLQYCSFTKPLGTAILTVISFMSTNIKLSIDCRSYLSLPATFLCIDWHSSSATVMWACLSFCMVNDTSDTNDTPVTG